MATELNSYLLSNSEYYSYTATGSDIDLSSSFSL